MKKIVIIGAVIVFFFLVFSFLYGLVLTKQSEVVPLNSSSVSQTYQSSYFSFSYPDSFVLTRGAENQGSSIVILRQRQKLESDLSMTIQATPVSIGSLESMENVEKAFGLAKKDVVVGKDKIKGAQYAGLLPFSSKPTQETVTLFEKNGYVYMISMSYVERSLNDDAEKLYAALLSSFVPR